ncbi:MAG: Rrf2 family transcriptional regulator [Liquorilactobacillus ghanensis]|uniref:RrF2 family transcriptional regulator n=1 Tax=Liquorilactobacillus ghanensis TaxID=399370 RepID=UPI0039E983FD
MSFSIAFSQAFEISSYIGIKSKEQQYKYLTIQQISKKLNIPIPSIKKISVLLKKNGILKSKTGAFGGLQLAKPANEISIYDILVSIEGSNPLFKIHTNFDTNIFINQKKVENWLQESSKVLNDAENAMLAILKKTSLEDIALKI